MSHNHSSPNDSASEPKWQLFTIIPKLDNMSSYRYNDYFKIIYLISTIKYNLILSKAK